jgi:hypothetical protein
MRRRIRFLCALLPTLQLVQCIAMAVTVIKRRPHRWAHEVADLVALASIIALITAVAVLLVILPLRSASRALTSLKQECMECMSSMTSTPFSVRQETSEGARLHLLPGTQSKSSDASDEGPMDEPLTVLAAEPQHFETGAAGSLIPVLAPLHDGLVLEGSSRGNGNTSRHPGGAIT